MKSSKDKRVWGILTLEIGSAIMIGIIILASYSSSTLPATSSTNVSTITETSSDISIPNSPSTPSAPNLSDRVPNSSSQLNDSLITWTGAIVPIFSSYSSIQRQDVNQVISTKLSHPNVPIIVILNPSDGPGLSFDPHYLSEVKDMQTSNVTVLGYVPLWWGARNISGVESDSRAYYTWYDVNGIYFDQTPNWEKDGPQGQRYYTGAGGTYIPAYLSNITNYVKSLGMSKVFANAGNDVPQNILSLVDNMGIFENGYAPPFSGWPSLAGIGNWHLGYSKTHFSFLSYNISKFNPYYIAGASDYVSYLYMTNSTSAQPYVTLPPYFDEMVSTLASMVPLRIYSETMNGTELNQIEVTMTQPDGISSSDYSPFVFNTIPGSLVTISASSSSHYSFSHWSDGSISATRNVTISQASYLIAYYKD